MNLIKKYWQLRLKIFVKTQACFGNKTTLGKALEINNWATSYIESNYFNAKVLKSILRNHERI
jgi:hypothetical protein